ncbi:C-type lectin domain family 2 member E-like [Argopecten irradians]|uniref:C-type lectin domain family 2 member E-like n=1 Tax=Argopecten irradians TaxID=31199 RepID=UPI003719D133
MKVDQNILVLGICIAMQTQIIQGCRNGWLQFENSCYLLSKDAATWAEASMICIDLESRLAAVETADESNFLKAEAHRLNASKSFIYYHYLSVKI